MMGAGMARWLAGSRWSTRPNLRWSRRSRAWGCWHRARRRALSGSPAGSRPTSGGSTWRAGRSASSGRWPSCGSPPTGARRSSATPTRPPGCATPRRSCRRRCRACSARTARRACWSWPICRQSRYRGWKADLLAGRAEPEVAAAVGERLAKIHAGTAHEADDRRSLPDRSDLPRHPPRALSRGDRTGASRSRRGAAPPGPGRPPRPGRPWCTAMSAPRTSWSGRRGRSSSMPSAPGMAIRRSIWRSASTTCC